MLQYYRYFAQARNTRIQAFRETLDSLSEVSANISGNTQKMQIRQQALRIEEAELAAQQGSRLALLDELDIELSERGASLASLEQQQREIELLLEELRSAITELNLGEADIPFAQRRGQLPWPITVQPGNRFGDQRGQGDLRWEGLLLPATVGSPVLAIHHGRVIFADWLGSSGLLLIIDHGDGFMSLYAHNQELYRTVGEWVSGGDQIATVGNTGGQRDSGLYFEIRRNGKAENPVNWCVDQR
jgi:septal ring factor EnvC (AmiA/AmiB activator)